MIGFLKGRVVERGLEGIVLDVNGVGYELTCSINTLVQIEPEPSSVQNTNEVQLWVQTIVREDAISLFGFASQLEKKMFLSLIKANGVGPKMAIKILSAATIEQLAQMIEGGDVKALSNLPKVGKKTAEQLVLSLKGKLAFEAEPMTAAGLRSGKKASAVLGTTGVARFSGVRAQILSALVNLGFRLPDAERVVEDLPDSVEFQNGLREGLQALHGGF